MKRIFILGLTLFLLTGCGNAKVDNNTNKKEDSKQTTTEEVKENINLLNIKNKIDELGITTSEEDVFFQMVGANAGTKIYSGDYRVEIYKFDTSTAEYKKAESSQKLEISEDMTFDAVVKNGYAYIIDDDFPQHDAVVELLNGLN